MTRKNISEESVVLVNRSGRKTGIAGKMTVHEKGLLHRAFSLFIFNSKGECLLQKRAPSKYHFGGLWTNACCSHPRPGERIVEAGKRRLIEELGFNTSLENYGHVYYSFHDQKTNLIEHEYDYLLTGKYDGAIHFNRNEVAAIKWIYPQKLLEEVARAPGKFTPWLRLILHEFSLQLLLPDK